MTDQNRTPYKGMWDWHGSLDPGVLKEPHGSYDTFSVGCFQWVGRGIRGDKPGLKKGKVQKRFSGSVSAPQAVYDKATAYCAQRNAG